MTTDPTALPIAFAIEEPSADDRAQEMEASISALEHDLQTLPTVTDVHEFGSTIEFIKNMLVAATSYIGILKEQITIIRDSYARSVRGDKSTLNDKDKQEVARLCAEDESLRQLEERVRALTERWTRWDARRSRLNREYEIARAEYESELRRRDADLLRTELCKFADYHANKLRNAL